MPLWHNVNTSTNSISFINTGLQLFINHFICFAQKQNKEKIT